MKLVAIIPALLTLPFCHARRPHSFLIPNTEVIEKATTVSRKEPIKGQLSTVKGNEVRKVSSKVLHSVEMVEKTIISAVRDEVDTLFHDRNHEQTN